MRQILLIATILIIINKSWGQGKGQFITKNSEGFYVNIHLAGGKACNTGGCNLVIQVTNGGIPRHVQLYIKLKNGDWYLVVEDKLGKGESTEEINTESLGVHCKFDNTASYRLFYY